MSQSRIPTLESSDAVVAQQLIDFDCGLLRIFIMARLSALTVIFISLFIATLANSQLSSQQPVTNEDGAVHTTESWSWEDCGQSFCM
jgi:hypothetical protein